MLANFVNAFVPVAVATVVAVVATVIATVVVVKYVVVIAVDTDFIFVVDVVVVVTPSCRRITLSTPF